MIDIALISGKIGWWLVYRWLRRILFSLIMFSIVWVLVLRFVPIWFTPLMLIRYWKADVSIKHHWRSMEKLPPAAALAAIAGEDQRFVTHHGFDWKEIMTVVLEKKQHRIQRGASTITQQVAKNVFLFPNRNWLRKGLEAYFTILLELLWDKKRIMEVYLNVAEMGNGIYGLEAAAKHYYGVPASKLSKFQAATIIASLPNPRKYPANQASGFITQRRNTILYYMQHLPPQYFVGFKPA
jgi:monofunctional glycosyltransferase